MISIKNNIENITMLKNANIEFTILKKRKTKRSKEVILEEKRQKLLRRQSRTPEQNKRIAFKCKRLRYIKSLSTNERMIFLTKIKSDQLKILDNL